MQRTPSSGSKSSSSHDERAEQAEIEGKRLTWNAKRQTMIDWEAVKSASVEGDEDMRHEWWFRKGQKGTAKASELGN